jgi:CRISPR/Cas system CSM-associated protein Csm2 small subunit
MALEITAAKPDPALLDLPWSVPLKDWPAEHLAALPRGISRHVVRFVKLSDKVIAVKESPADIAVREYNMLRLLTKLGQPCVQPLGVITGRTSPSGDELEACLVTCHLQFSLPYRALFSQSLRPDTAQRLIDALAVLLVRLHLAGFWWGDVSLSNTLFRRDAGAFAAYLVDAETGEIHNQLSNGQREHDLDIAQVNIAGELMDLAAAGFLAESADPIEVSESIVDRYRSLWRELTERERFEQGDRWRVEERIRRLNELGFDVDELAISTDIGGATIQIQPKVVDAGHHSRRLLRLTGLDVEENQARRLLNDLDAFRASQDRQNDREEIVAHDWLSRIYEPITRTVPRDLTRKLEPAEVFHEVLEHRWYMSEKAGRDTTIEDAIADYVRHVLPGKPDEAAVLGVTTGEIPVVVGSELGPETGTHGT